MTQNSDNKMDQLDLMILREMEIDGRQSVSDLSKKLGISRAYAGKKLKRLLDLRLTRIAAFTKPLALGYRTGRKIAVKPDSRRSSRRLRGV